MSLALVCHSSGPHKRMVQCHFVLLLCSENMKEDHHSVGPPRQSPDMCADTYDAVCPLATFSVPAL